MSARGGLLVLASVVVLAAYFWLNPRLPKDQSVNVVLGDSAPTVTEVAVSYAHDGDPMREAELRFEPGQAPRVVHHEPRLPDGDYVVGIRVRSARGIVERQRRVTLASTGSTAIDVSGAAP